MKKIWDNFVSIGYLGMSLAVSVLAGASTSWQWHDLDMLVMIKVFGLIMVITLICDIPNLISNFKNRSKK
jgi:hypothetical protein